MSRVKAAFFSMTPRPHPDDDGSYLRWHLLDHMPEQYQLPGMILGTRWSVDDELAHLRIAAQPSFEHLGGVVNYLIGDPVQATHDAFLALGRSLAEIGRFPERRPSLGLEMLAVRGREAAPSAMVSAEVVPFRPHRGIIFVLEELPREETRQWDTWLETEHVPHLLRTPGVAGVWSFGPGRGWNLGPGIGTQPRRVTVVYLDRDPGQSTGELRGAIEERWRGDFVRPLFAGPLRSMVRWEAWPED